MDKSQFLSDVKSAAQSKLVSKEELLQAFSSGSETAGSEEKTRVKITVSEVIQYVGGAIVFFGIALLVANNWNTLSELTRILVTFGSAMLAFALGIPLFRQEKNEKLGLVFLLIAMMLMPLGIFSIMDALKADLQNTWIMIGYELTLAAVYGASYFAINKKLYVLPFAFFLTALFFTASTSLIGPLSPADSTKFDLYRSLIVGVSFVLLAQYFVTTQKRVFPSFFYLLGVIIVLSTALGLGGWKPTDLNGILWEFAYPVLAFGIMFFGIYIKQSKILILAAVALMGYVLKISGEYFSTGLGWPLALVIAGFLMIGIGYVSLLINRKYIRGAAN